MRIVKIGITTIVISLFVLSIIFFVAGNKRINTAIKLNNITIGLNNRIAQPEKIQPHTVVLLETNEQGLWVVVSIKRFEHGQEKEFIAYLKRE